MDTLASPGAAHVPDDQAIRYADSPPAAGPHRAQWANWGEFSYLPPQRWLHNLEHGGAALLYHPCAPAEVVDGLRAYAQGRADDEGGAFRWILTPYADLPTAVAVVTWEWRWMSECLAEAEVDAFLAEHYRKASEDVSSDGGYDVGWIGR